MNQTTCNPDALVAGATFEQLVAAYAYDLGVFGCGWIDNELHFVCPYCQTKNLSAGTARVIDGFRWKCFSCRRTGTRKVLDRIVLENFEMLDVLFWLTR